MKGGDVDLGSGQRVPERADEARLVVVAHEQHMTAELGIERYAVNLDQAGLVAGKEGAGDGVLAILGAHRNTYQRVIIPRLRPERLGDAYVALTADQRGVDHVYRRELRRQHPG